MDYKIAKKVCKILKIDEAPIMAELTADRESDSTVKKTWHEIAKRLTSTAGVMIVTITFMQVEAANYQHCILCKIKEILIYLSNMTGKRSESKIKTATPYV